MRIVLDTYVVASALLYGGTPRQLLRAARGGKVALATSTPMLVELADLPARRKFASRIAAQRFSIDELLARYVHLNLVVPPAPVAGVAVRSERRCRDRHRPCRARRLHRDGRQGTAGRSAVPGRVDPGRG